MTHEEVAMEIVEKFPFPRDTRKFYLQKLIAEALASAEKKGSAEGFKKGFDAGEETGWSRAIEAALEIIPQYDGKTYDQINKLKRG